MKRFLKFLFLLGSTFLLAGCDFSLFGRGSSFLSSSETPTYHLFTEEPIVDLEKETSYQLKIESDAPYELPLTYQTSDHLLSLTEDGVISAYDPGVYHVFVSSKEAINTLDIQVNVINPSLAYDGEGSIELHVGETYDLSYMIEYIGAAPSKEGWFDESRVKVNLSAKEAEKISVDENFRLTALKAGFVSLELEIDGAHSMPLRFDITILNQPYFHNIKEERGIFIGESLIFSFNSYPVEDKPLPFSEDEEIVSIVTLTDGNGVSFEGKKEGSTTIGYLHQGRKVAYKVYVYHPERFQIENGILKKAINLEGIEYLYLPSTYQEKSITTIAANAFVDTLGDLTTMVFSSTVVKIEKNAFVSINDNVEGDRHTDFILPSLSCFEEGSFDACWGIKLYVYGKENNDDFDEQIGDVYYDFHGEIGQDEHGFVYYTYNSNHNARIVTCLSSKKEIIVPETLPGSSYPLEVKQLAPYFGSNLYEAKVSLPSSLETIGECAFYGTGAKTILISEGTKTIGSRAFCSSSLESLFLPSSLEKIVGNPFLESEKLKVYYPKSKEQFYSLFESLFEVLPLSVPLIYNYGGEKVIEEAGFSYALCRKDGESYLTLIDFILDESYINHSQLVVPSKAMLNGVTYPVYAIGEYAFQSIRKFDTLVISEGIKEIQSYAFWNSKWKEIQLPRTLETIEDHAFTDIQFEEDSSLIIPREVTNIDDRAFESMSYFMDNFALFFEEENISSSLVVNWNIAYGAGYKDHGVTEDGLFYGILEKEGKESALIYGVKNDTTLSNELSLNTISYQGREVPVREIGPATFEGRDELENVILNDDIQKMGGGVFDSCENLISIRLSRAFISIPHNTFSGCISLTTMTNMDNIQQIDAYAFSRCHSLLHFTVPSAVIEIGDYAFSSCESLKSIYFTVAVTKIGFGFLSDSYQVEAYTDHSLPGPNWDNQWDAGFDQSRMHYSTSYNTYLKLTGQA